MHKHKAVSFVNVSDGSCLGDLQITLSADATENDAPERNLRAKLSDITVDSSVFAKRELQEGFGGQH